MNQEHAHRQRFNQQQQANHVVTNLSAASTAYSRRQASKITPGDWAHVLPEAETGCLLLAPETEEGWWRHSVVLVLNHDAEGSTGISTGNQRAAQNVVPEIDYSAPHHRVLAKHVSRAVRWARRRARGVRGAVARGWTGRRPRYLGLWRLYYRRRGSSEIPTSLFHTAFA